MQKQFEDYGHKRFLFTPELIRRASTISFGFMVLCIFSYLLFYHYLLICSPYPLEYREGAMLLATDLLMRGQNPFDMANMPLATNMYGIGYPLAVSIVAQILGSSLQVHHLVAGIFMVACCALLFIIMLKEGINAIYIFASISIFYASLLYGVTSVARPDSLGMFLFLLSIFIPYLCKYSKLSLLLSIVAGIIAYYTKQYFILSCFYICTYLFLFISKKKAIYYGAAITFLFIISAIAINYFFETYFLNTVFTFQTTVTSWSWLLNQIKRYFLVNIGLLLIVAFYIYKVIWNKNAMRISSHVFNFTNADEPFLTLSCSLPLYCLLLSCFFICIVLGRNTGAWLNYLYQLITPFLLIFSFNCITKLLASNNLFSESIDKYRYAFAMLLIITTSFVCSLSLPLPPGGNDNQQWIQIENMIISSNNILNSPAIAPLLIEHKKPLYDSGLSEAWKDAGYSLSILSFFLPPVEAIENRWSKYTDSINQLVIQKKFDLIILTDSIPNPFISSDTIEKYYQKSESITLPMHHANQYWRLNIWKPRQ